MTIIDSHVHLFRREHWDETSARTWLSPFGLDPDIMDVDTDELMEGMANAGVDQVVFLAFNAARFLKIHTPNEYVASECARFSGRAIGYASVDPIENNAVAELIDAIDNMGLRGLKLAPTYQDFHPQDPRAYRVYAACEERGVPILFHQGWTPNPLARADVQAIEQLDEICKVFPDLRIIVAHIGIPRTTETLQMMFSYPNLYADISGRDFPQFGGGPRTVLEDISDAMAFGIQHKIFWGTDAPWGDPAAGIKSVHGLLDMVGNLEASRPKPTIDEIEGLLGKNFQKFAADLGWDEVRQQ
jgi:predicted TIM-barrel fold metal-dependent hydrolase